MDLNGIATSRIRLRLDRVMQDQRVTLTELAGRVGLTLANLSILKTNKARAVRFSTLAALCRELECQPGDLLEFVEMDQPLVLPEPADAAPAGDHGLPGDYY
jgi:putative transcriptional regulator